MTFVRAVARFALLASILTSLLVISAAPAAASAAPTGKAEQVIATAKQQRGDRWSHFAKGPDKFDCVGLVAYAFKVNQVKHLIGGYNGVRGYYKWFKRQGRADLNDPKPGDLVIWGKFEHIGIYVGDGMAVSALVNPHGVSVHPVSGYIRMKVKAYLHVKWDRSWKGRCWFRASPPSVGFVAASSW